MEIKKYGNKPRWWSHQLQRLKNRRDKLFKRKSNDQYEYSQYVSVSNEFIELSNQRFNEYSRNLFYFILLTNGLKIPTSYI